MKKLITIKKQIPLIGIDKERLAGVSNICKEIYCLTDLEKMGITEETKQMDCVLIGQCLEGEMQLEIDGIEHKIEAQDAFVISIGHTVRNLRCSKNTHCLALLGTRSFFHEVVKEMLDVSKFFMYVNSSPIRHFSSLEQEMFSNAFNILTKRASILNRKYGLPFAISVVRAYCYDYFNSNVDMEMQSTPPSTKGEKVFYEFVNLVEKNFRTQRRVGWYAKQIGISSKYLSELVKTVSRETPNSWIDKYVVMELRVLLHNPNLNIKEITEIMNFPNQSFLGKYFKEHVGMSPLAYRKTL